MSDIPSDPTDPESKALKNLKNAFTTFEARSKIAKQRRKAEKTTIAKTIAIYERTGQLRVAGRQEAIAKKEESVETTFRQAMREATELREEGRARVAQTKLNYLEEEQKIKAGQQKTVKRDLEAADVTFRQANENIYFNLIAAFNVYVSDLENSERESRIRR